jgi:hypothetical protein
MRHFLDQANSKGVAGYFRGVRADKHACGRHAFGSQRATKPTNYEHRAFGNASSKNRHAVSS